MIGKIASSAHETAPRLDNVKPTLPTMAVIVPAIIDQKLKRMMADSDAWCTELPA